MARRKVTDKHLKKIYNLLIEGCSLVQICRANPDLPSRRTLGRFFQENEEHYIKYRQARAIQAEFIREDCIDLVEKELPTDPKLAMAEVQRRRLEVDTKDKFIRQLAPLGLRNKVEDTNKEASGSITLTWDSASIS